jgi:hypothetical protein
MARFAVHVQFQGHKAFFSHAHQRDRRRHAGQNAVRDEKAFIQHKLRHHTALPQQRRHRLRTGATYLFVVAERE